MGNKLRGRRRHDTHACDRSGESIRRSFCCRSQPRGIKGEIRGGPGERPEWPAWVRVVVSLVLLFHGLAVLTGALGVPPSSMLERQFADAFMPYYGLLDLGYAYRFYAEPPPTPVVTATLRYTSRPDEMVRLPGRERRRASDASPAAACAG